MHERIFVYLDRRCVRKQRVSTKYSSCTLWLFAGCKRLQSSTHRNTLTHNNQVFLTATTAAAKPKPAHYMSEVYELLQSTRKNTNSSTHTLEHKTPSQLFRQEKLGNTQSHIIKQKTLRELWR